MKTQAFLAVAAFALTATTACSKSKDDKRTSEKQAPAVAKSAAKPKALAQPKAVEPEAKKAVKAKPDEYHTVTLSLIVKDVDAAIAYYSDIFGAKKIMTLPGPDGKTMHGEVQIGDSRIMIGVEMPGLSKAPETLGGTTGSLLVYVQDVDAVVAKAEAAKAKVLMKVEDQFWGDRWGMVLDPFGHAWGVATHKFQVPPEKMPELAAAAFSPDKKTEIPGTPAKHWQPERLTTVVPSLHLADHKAALAFYEQGLGGKLLSKTMMPDGKTLMHAEIQLGDSVIMFSDETPDMPNMPTKSPKTLGGAPFTMYVFTEDVDKAFATAVAQKGAAKYPVTDQPWGDRTGSVMDPSGHEWMLATHKEDLSPEEINKRMMAAMAKMGAGHEGHTQSEAKK